MKLGLDIQHRSTCNVPKHKGINELAGGGHNQKTMRKCHKIKRTTTFASSKTNSDNAKEKEIFSLPSITIQLQYWHNLRKVSWALTNHTRDVSC